MAANTDFRAIIKSGNEDRLVEFLHSDEFEKDPVSWFPVYKSPFLTATLVNVHFLDLIIVRLYELGVLEEVCTTRLGVPMTNIHSEKQNVLMTPLQCVIETRRYNAIITLLKYPECWKATYIPSTKNTTAVSTCIGQMCIVSDRERTLMESVWLEKLLGVENPYVNVCLKECEPPEISPIDKVFIQMNTLLKRPYGGISTDPYALAKCKELVALRRSENGSFTKRAV